MRLSERVLKKCAWECVSVHSLVLTISRAKYSKEKCKRYSSLARTHVKPFLHTSNRAPTDFSIPRIPTHGHRQNQWSQKAKGRNRRCCWIFLVHCNKNLWVLGRQLPVLFRTRHHLLYYVTKNGSKQAKKKSIKQTRKKDETTTRIQAEIGLPSTRSNISRLCPHPHATNCQEPTINHHAKLLPLISTLPHNTTMCAEQRPSLTKKKKKRR